MAEQRDKPAPSRAAESPSEDRGELIRRRIAAVVILIAVAIAIMALTDAAPFFDDVTEEQRVTDTVERFFGAFEQRDFATVCSLFSTDVRQQIETVGATQTKKGEPKGCTEILEARYAEVPEEQTKFSLKIEDVRVSGPRAVADVIVKTQQVPKGRSLPIELEQGPDGWLVTRQVITG